MSVHHRYSRPGVHVAVDPNMDANAVTVDSDTHPVDSHPEPLRLLNGEDHPTARLRR